MTGVVVCATSGYGTTVALHLTADLEDRYRQFLTRVCETGQVWLLLSADGRGATLEARGRFDADGSPAVAELAFSAAALASRLAHREWSTYAARAIPLADYLRVLTQLGSRVVVPDPTEDLAGLEVPPAALGEAVRDVLHGKTPELVYLSTSIAEAPGAPMEKPVGSVVGRLDGDIFTTPVGFTIRLAKPWRMRRTRAGETVLSHGRARLHVFAGLPSFIEDDTDEHWARRWRDAVPHVLSARTDDAELVVSRQQVGARGRLQVVSVFSARWTPAFAWLWPDGAPWSLRLDSEVQRLESDLYEVSQLVETIALDARNS